jgi:hypothetical protein
MFSGSWPLKPVNLIVWITVAAVILWLFYFYPSCIFHRLTGLFCPGCGSRRAVLAVLDGNWRQAAGYNILLMAAVGERVVYFILAGFKLRFYSSNYLRFLLIIALGFGILRNLPVEPFCWLAP